MKRQKIVLKHCPHFYKILDFEIYEDDVISSKLISLYKDYIFSIDVTDERALKKVEKIDLIISKFWYFVYNVTFKLYKKLKPKK